MAKPVDKRNRKAPARKSEGDSGGSWGCPHNVAPNLATGGKAGCALRGKECLPGAKGCVLEGRLMSSGTDADEDKAPSEAKK